MANSQEDQRDVASAVQAHTPDEPSGSWAEAVAGHKLPASAHDATAPNPRRPLPAALGRYTIEAELGRGTMGVVYRATDPMLDRKVALKVIDPISSLCEEEQRLMEERFLREARLAARVTHPNIVAVHDVGWDTEARRPYMALEYLEGQTLAQVLASGQAMAWSDALRLVSQLAEALHYAHGYGIVHRDIKPANIMILPSGDPKIMDFGIAKSSTGELTSSGDCWGTPRYMSPEQASGKPLDGRTDLFSLGSVLYQMLTGRRAFEGENVPQIMTRVVNDEPPPPSRINPALPRDLDMVIARALAKDPAQRYPNGQAFAEDLQDVLNSRPLRERDGLKTLLMLEPTASHMPTEVVAATALLGTHAHVRSRIRVRRPLLAVGAGLAIGLALLGFRYSTVAKAPASSDTPATTATLDLSVASAPAPPAQSVPPPTVGRPRGDPSVAAPAPLARLVPPPTVRRPRGDPGVAAPEPSPLPPTVPPAHLALSVKHSEKQSRFRLWIDEQLVVETDLTGSGTWHTLVVTKHQGPLAEAFGVAPGDRFVRIEVEEDGERRSGGISGAFASSETRLLEVKLGGNVSLKWKS